MPELQVIGVYASSAAQPWLEKVYSCAPEGTAIRLESDAAQADISLRLGEPRFSPKFIYQIDAEDILVVTHRESPLQNLTLEGVRELFARPADPSVQVWIYASGEDVQEIFEQVVMQGRSVTSFARLATSTQHMAEVVVGDVQAVGFLPRSLQTEGMRIIHILPEVPVLVSVENDPRGVIQEIIYCLQK